MSSEKADKREAAFMATWLEANKGKVRDTFKEVKSANNGAVQGAPTGASVGAQNAPESDDEDNVFAD